MIRQQPCEGQLASFQNWNSITDHCWTIDAQKEKVACWPGAKPPMKSPWPPGLQDDVSARIHLSTFIQISNLWFMSHLVYCSLTRFLSVLRLWGAAQIRHKSNMWISDYVNSHSNQGQFLWNYWLSLPSQNMVSFQQI